MNDKQFKQLMEALEPISLYYGGLICDQVEKEEQEAKEKKKK
jgi:hypothetical protein